MKIIASNKKAYFNYFIEDTFEAGISLVGSEVKSIRAGHISLDESFVAIYDGEVFLKNAYIKPYEKATSSVVDSKRDRKLLLNKKEIVKLSRQIAEKGFTMVATKVYFAHSLVKVQIALAKGKHLYDKKQVLKERDEAKDLKRELVHYN
ncbi:MAG: SsrA-binding protein SmpB [Clostridia bacterium]|nr:SsrA-binding protein SmpB [Clostridia bacterium]